ncbi:MAG: dihydrolipoyl dehydrogenase [Firmicutes bacterium]|nr:dihydrolipoyl dehydrogenase [Bacillota bacterium]MBE3590890.1 dihydrolipoyl dehydrogenase [Bacillota bacterium]
MRRGGGPCRTGRGFQRAPSRTNLVSGFAGGFQEGARHVADFDVVVLGGGTGGYVAAIRAAQLGMKAALVEEDKVGGTCLHRGCIPTKVMLQAADLLHDIRRAAEFGLTPVAGADVDWAGLAQRKHRIVTTLHRGVEYLLKKNGVELVRGRGALDGPGRVRVGERVLTASHTIIATGSRPRELPGLPFDGRRVISSDHALQLERRPASVVVVGAGAVGVEFASLFRDFGAEVTLVEWLPRLMPLEDEDVSAELQRAFEKRGIRCLTGAQVLAPSVRAGEGGVELVVRRGEEEVKLEAEVLLVAVGRAARVEDCGLETAGVAVERGFIRVDGWMRTNVPGVYAIGDAVGGLQLAHVAAHEGIVAVETAAGHEPDPIDYTKAPRATYCRPQVASVGYSEREAREAGYRVKAGTFPFRAIGKALIVGEGEGFCKVVADEDGGVLGVHLIGPHATDLIAEGALLRFMDGTAWELGTVIHPHPTLSEVLGEAGLAVEGRAIHV